MDLVESLIKYFAETSDDVLVKDKEECEPLNEIGPFLEDKENMYRFDFLKFNKPIFISSKNDNCIEYAVGICHNNFSKYNQVFVLDQKTGNVYDVFPGDLEENDKISIQEKIDNGEFAIYYKCSYVMIREIIDKTFRNTEANNDIFINTLNSIKYDELIGGPLKACIESQAVAAMRSWRFLQECGLGGDVQKYHDLITFAKPFIETNNSPGIFDLLSQLNEELCNEITEINRKQHGRE